MGVGGQRHAPAAFTPRKDPVPIVQEAGWASRPVWIGAENLAPTGIRSPDLPARSESLYRVRYPGPRTCMGTGIFLFPSSHTQLTIQGQTAYMLRCPSHHNVF